MKRKRIGKKAIAYTLSTSFILASFGMLKFGSYEVNAEESWTNTSKVIDGDFEGSWDLTAWNSDSIYWSSDFDGAASVTDSGESSRYFNAGGGGGIKAPVNLYQEVELEKGTYRLTLDYNGANADTGLKLYAGAREAVIWPSKAWEWVSEETYVDFTMDDAGKIVIGVKGSIGDGCWIKLDNIKLLKADAEKVSEDPVSEDTEYEPEDSEVAVKKNDIIAKNSEFITGFDLSSYVSLKNSGVKYYDFDGKELNDQEFFNFLYQDCDVNYVRIRVWNDPYDASGNGYGGGNNDLATAIKIGKLATNAGMKVLIDFQYSDFWADPGKQDVPKAWSAYLADEKVTAIYNYTKASLESLKANGVNVGMVQVGNETNGFLCGETNWDTLSGMFSAGSKAIRETFPEALVALHFANPETSGRYQNYAKQLNDHNVDYDVFASSYYPYFHGSVDNLKNVLSQIAATYQKRVMVAETQYIYTMDDFDGHENSRNPNNSNDYFYSISTQGQVDCISAVANAVTSCGNLEDGTAAGIGLFYWEPAWLPVNVVKEGDADYDSKLEKNKEIWNKYGSGWAASFAGEYQSDAANWWGGSPIDNEALFDPEGHPLVSLKAYHYLRTGSKAVLRFNDVDKIEDQVIEVGGSYTLPEKVKARFNDGSSKEVVVSWDDKTSVDVTKAGTYLAKGSFIVEEENVNKERVNNSYEIKAKITVEAYNYLLNPKFEDEEIGKGWTVNRISGFNSEKDGAIVEDKSNAKSGTHVIHFWSDKDFSLEAQQKLVLNKGIYRFSGFVEGEMKSDLDTVKAFLILKEDKKESENVTLSGWLNWQEFIIDDITITEDNTELTVGIRVDGTKGSWGDFDDFYLIKTGDISVEEIDNKPSGIENDKTSGTEGDKRSELAVKPAANKISKEETAKPAEIKPADKISETEKGYSLKRTDKKSAGEIADLAKDLLKSADIKKTEDVKQEDIKEKTKEDSKKDTKEETKNDKKDDSILTTGADEDKKEDLDETKENSNNSTSEEKISNGKVIVIVLSILAGLGIAVAAAVVVFSKKK